MPTRASPTTPPRRVGRRRKRPATSSRRPCWFSPLASLTPAANARSMRCEPRASWACTPACQGVQSRIRFTRIVDPGFLCAGQIGRQSVDPCRWGGDSAQLCSLGRNPPLKRALSEHRNRVAESKLEGPDRLAVIRLRPRDPLLHSLRHGDVIPVQRQQLVDQEGPGTDRGVRPRGQPASSGPSGDGRRARPGGAQVVPVTVPARPSRA